MADGLDRCRERAGPPPRLARDFYGLEVVLKVDRDVLRSHSALAGEAFAASATAIIMTAGAIIELEYHCHPHLDPMRLLVRTNIIMTTYKSSS